MSCSHHSRYQNLLPFHASVIFHCVDRPHIFFLPLSLKGLLYIQGLKKTLTFIKWFTRQSKKGLLCYPSLKSPSSQTLCLLREIVCVHVTGIRTLLSPFCICTLHCSVPWSRLFETSCIILNLFFLLLPHTFVHNQWTFRQVLSHLSRAPSPFCFGHFWNAVSLLCLGQPGL
jgi:hypothetical protein